jgi:Tol biopolymer transport system component
MPEPVSEPSGPPTGPTTDRLDSWKEIAAYLGRGVTTVQRWEQEDGLPIHRLPHAKKGSVFAYQHELDAWFRERGTSRAGVDPAITPAAPNAATGPSSQPASPQSWSAGRLLPASLVVAVFVTLAVIAWTSNSAGEDSGPTPQPGSSPTFQPVRPVPLVASSQDERAPSLSPDGRSLAFAWTQGSQGGVFTKSLPDGEPQLLWPFEAWRQAVYITKWAPDGASIAFNSLEGDDTKGLYVIGASGGDPIRLTSMAGIGICWTADARAITFADRPSTTEAFALYAVDVATRQRTRLTTPPAGSFGDTACAWSRDGQRLAFARFVTRYDADVFVTEPARATAPIRLASGRGGIDDLEWTPDDREVVFTNAPGLRRVPADGTIPATDVRGIGGEIGHPTFSRPAAGGEASFAFQQQGTSWLAQVWRSDNPLLHTPWQRPAGADVEFPDLTRDGQRLTYVDRGQVWTAGIDGSRPRQVTFHDDAGQQRIITGPRWSPDGRRLAFSVPVGSQRDIYVIDADGSNSFRLTSEPSIEDNPSWSADSRWIYFRSDRAGLNHLWRAPSSGGPARQITAGEGWQGLESPDRRFLYFVRGTSHRGLWRIPVDGGQEHLVLEGVQDSRWALTDTAVLYVEAADSESPRLRIWRDDGGQARTLARFPAQVSAGFSASADGRTMVWTLMERRLSDILLVSPWPR